MVVGFSNHITSALNIGSVIALILVFIVIIAMFINVFIHTIQKRNRHFQVAMKYQFWILISLIVLTIVLRFISYIIENL